MLVSTTISTAPDTQKKNHSAQLSHRNANVLAARDKEKLCQQSKAAAATPTVRWTSGAARDHARERWSWARSAGTSLTTPALPTRASNSLATGRSYRVVILKTSAASRDAALAFCQWSVAISPTRTVIPSIRSYGAILKAASVSIAADRATSATERTHTLPVVTALAGSLVCAQRNPRGASVCPMMTWQRHSEF